MSQVPRIVVSVDVLTQYETISQYFSSAEELLGACRIAARRHAVVRTHTPAVVNGFMALHRLGELDVTVRRNCGGGDIVYYALDVKGRMINPWPDDFFVLEFYLNYSDFTK